MQIDRSIAIEAAIVRIMKSRKRLEHNILIQEVLMHLNAFKPDVSVIDIYIYIYKISKLRARLRRWWAKIIWKEIQMMLKFTNILRSQT